MKPIDIYARVSYLKRDEKRELSTEGQIAVCRARLADLGLPVGKVLVDLDRSAWNPNVKREAWDELIDRLESGISGGAIMFDLERLTRQPKDGERIIDLADRGLLILDSESEYDLTTPKGKKAFRDAINAAAYYSDRLSTRVRRGLRMRAMSGLPTGPSRRFGFEEDRITIREDEAEIIRETTRRMLAGEIQERLLDDLNTRGILTRDGHQWGRTTLRQLLTRSINCGKITKIDRKTGEAVLLGRLPGEPIVNEEDFDRLCALYASHRRGRPNSLTYLCSGIAVCGAPGCSNPLHGRLRKDLKVYPDGSVRRNYWCSVANKGCGKTQIDQRALDEAARALVIEILSDPRNTAAIEIAARETASETARLDLAIAEAEKVAEALADRLGRGEIKLSRYDVAIRPLDARIEKLRAERAALSASRPAPVPPRLLEASREQWRRRWDAADHKERRDLLKMALGGKHLVIGPVEHGPGSTEQTDIIRRIEIK